MKLEALKRACADYIAGVVTEAIGLREGDISVDCRPNTTDVTFNTNVTITYNELKLIADVLGTKSIDLNYSHGWGGTEVTPGTDSELGLEVGVGYETGAVILGAQERAARREPQRRKGRRS